MKIDGRRVLVVLIFILVIIGWMGWLECKVDAENVKCKTKKQETEVAPIIESTESVEDDDMELDAPELELEAEIKPWIPISEFEAAPVELETKAYTNYKVIGKGGDSAQSEYIYSHLTVCDDGYLRDKDGFIAAALGSYFGGYHADSIGTRWVFVCKDGTEIPIVKVDIKQNNHTLDAEHKIGVISGRYDNHGNSVRTGEYIEFYVDVDKINGLVYTNSNPCINTTPGMDGVIVGWYQVESEKETESKSEIELSDYDRWFIECVVAGEAGGEPYKGKLAVAQCYFDAMLKDGLSATEVKSAYGYSGWNENLDKQDPKAYDEVKNAVADVFYGGKFVTDKPILYFYAPAYGRSDWHEAQEYWKSIANHKFFYLAEDVNAEWANILLTNVNEYGMIEP